MFEKRLGFGRIHPIYTFELSRMASGGSSIYDRNICGTEELHEIVKELSIELEKSYMEIDRLEALQPKTIKSMMGYRPGWDYHETRHGVYELTYEDDSVQVVVFDPDIPKDFKDVSTGFTTGDIRMSIVKNRLVYELPPKEKEFEVRGIIATKVALREKATSQEEAIKIVRDLYKPISKTRFFLEGECVPNDEDPFAYDPFADD